MGERRQDIGCSCRDGGAAPGQDRGDAPCDAVGAVLGRQADGVSCGPSVLS
ncbi:hypothetical protein HBB16_05885 [Pseudonocardia sp. MCCB 268]|nr:hypothetical protein [Pseudonocardia cytotoxica]